jgi:hypothetical protein
MIDWKLASKLLPSRLPEFVREDARMFVLFLSAYYDWLDNQGNPSWGINNFLLELDIDQTEAKFISSFWDSYMATVPSSALADPRLLLKHIKPFYLARGSETSFRFLFRVFFNTEIDFYYPGNDIFRLDNSEWIVLTSLKITPAAGIDPNQYLNREVYGSTSGARTGITNVISYYTAGLLIFELYYASSIGAFVAGEEVVDYETNATIGTIIAGGVVSYPGYYDTYNSQPDGPCKLQDDYYYQAYSYVVKSPISSSAYEQLVANLLHPAGTLLFPQFQGFSQEQLPIASIQNSVISLDVPVAYALPLAYGNSAFATSTLALPPLAIYDTDVSVPVSYASSYEPWTVQADYIQIQTYATLGSIAGFTGSIVASWQGATFTNGTGVIGIGNTSFLSYLSVSQPVEIIDDSGANAPAPNAVAAVDSNTTMRLVFPYAGGSLANGQIYTY